EVEVGVVADPDALPVEAPASKTALDAFLIAKYELTRAQWLLMANESPNRFTAANGPPDMMTGRSPVEQVAWRDAQLTLERYGLVLPTEVQWEYAARGGRASRWWTGDDKESLARGGAAENLADATATATGVPASEAGEWPDYDDGFPLHGPVGSLLPNPYGLFDVLGNVKELCADVWLENCKRRSPRPGDGLRDVDRTGSRACRGGSWFNGINQARVTARRSIGEFQVFDNVGIRAAAVIPKGR
ncbi:MAG: SUMF1/EgtB/PvdO family nonheme iron enzyme, partial [Planctomycetes bacterium]|nr:SUMF1/EgtB/PvdO family nonheme iron enzyme [Planctomycetota bacterium]